MVKLKALRSDIVAGKQRETRCVGDEEVVEVLAEAEYELMLTLIREEQGGHVWLAVHELIGGYGVTLTHHVLEGEENGVRVYRDSLEFTLRDSNMPPAQKSLLVDILGRVLRKHTYYQMWELQVTE